MVALERGDLRRHPVHPVVAGQLAFAIARFLGEAAQHREQPGAREQRKRARVLREKRVELLQRLVRRPRTGRECQLVAHTRGKLSAEPRVPERLLGCLRPVVPAAAEVGHPVAKRTPGVHETGVVSGLLKQRQRLSRKPLQLVDVRIGHQPRAVEGGHGTGKGLTGLIPGGAGSLRSGVGDIDGFSVQLESLGEVEFERDIQPQRPRQVERSVEQPGGGTVVAPPERAPAGGGKSLARALRLRVIGLTELCLVADGLLEVVAENLIQLDQASAVRLQPAGESVVQLGPGRFRQRVVGSIPNQDVPEAKGVLSRKSRLLWANQLLADERREARSHLGLAREGLHRSAVEDLALDRSTFEYRSLRELQLVEASGEQGLQGRWHDRVAACLAGSALMKRGLPPEAWMMFSRRSAEITSGISSSTCCSASGSRRSATGHSGRRPMRLARAIQRSKMAAPAESNATCSTRSRKVSSAQWRSSKTQTSGASSSSSLRKAQAISSAEVPSSVWPSRERREAAAAGSDGSASSCFSASTTGQ